MMKVGKPCDKWNKTKIIIYILKYVFVCLDMIVSYLEDVKYREQGFFLMYLNIIIL
jgi:hypothetical protein